MAAGSSKTASISRETSGLLLMLLSAVLNSFAGAFLKLAHDQGRLPSSELAFLRGSSQVILSVVGLYLCRDEKGRRLIWRPFGTGSSAKIVLAIRGFFGGMSFVTDFYGVSNLPLGDAVTLASLYPVLTIFMAKVVLDEEIRFVQLLASLVTALGAVLIAQPTFLFGSDTTTDSYPALGYIAALSTSFALACSFTLIRKAGKMGLGSFHMTLSVSLSCVVLSMINKGLQQGNEPWISLPKPSSAAFWYIIANLAVGMGTHFLLNYAGRLVPAGPVSMIRASDILWGYALEVLMFNQIPNRWTFLGVVLILGALSAIAFEKFKAVQRQRKSHAESAYIKKESNLDSV